MVKSWNATQWQLQPAEDVQTGHADHWLHPKSKQVTRYRAVKGAGAAAAQHSWISIITLQRPNQTLTARSKYISEASCLNGVTSSTLQACCPSLRPHANAMLDMCVQLMRMQHKVHSVTIDTVCCHEFCCVPLVPWSLANHPQHMQRHDGQTRQRRGLQYQTTTVESISAPGAAAQLQALLKQQTNTRCKQPALAVSVLKQLQQARQGVTF